MADERSSRVSKNKPEIYRDFTKRLNQIFKSEPDDAQNNAAKILSQFCDTYIPKTKDGCTQWFLPLDTEIPNHTIVLLAHSIRPIRCIGEITKNEQCSKAIPLKYRYIVEKLMKREISKEENIEEVEAGEGEEEDETGESPEKKKKKKKTKTTAARPRRRRIETVMVSCGKKQQQLISKKKGFWVIWKPSLEANIKTIDLPMHMETVLGWYSRYVEGMEKNPCPTYPRDQDDIYSEQFIMDQHPTPEWRKHTQEYQKTNKSNRGDGGEMMPPPPPPPPPPLSPASSSCSVDEEEQEISTKHRKTKKKRRQQSQGKQKKQRLTYEPICEVESSAQELKLFDAEGFSKFMEQFRNPDPPKHDILDFDDLGELPDLEPMGDDVLSP